MAKEVFVKGHTRTRKGRPQNVTPHFRHALVKQGKVVGFIKIDNFRGARIAPIKPSEAFKKGLKELQRSPSWKKNDAFKKGLKELQRSPSWKKKN